MQINKKCKFNVKIVIPKKPFITRCKHDLLTKQVQYSTSVRNVAYLGKKIKYILMNIIIGLFKVN